MPPARGRLHLAKTFPSATGGRATTSGASATIALLAPHTPEPRLLVQFCTSNGPAPRRRLRRRCTLLSGWPDGGHFGYERLLRSGVKKPCRLARSPNPARSSRARAVRRRPMPQRRGVLRGARPASSSCSPPQAAAARTPSMKSEVPEVRVAGPQRVVPQGAGRAALAVRSKQVAPRWWEVARHLPAATLRSRRAWTAGCRFLWSRPSRFQTPP